MTALRRLLRYGLFALAFAPLSLHASTALVYVTNSAGDSIHVINATTNKVVQVINGVEAAHGINFAADGSKVYVSDDPPARLMCSIVRAASSSRRLSFPRARTISL